ncbi:hypothetical protein B0H67DRAFT_638143 [Lasiosphaeris hirsuta]|uniref:Uncharacterized protein n=1 Tax=Lasiosphaeris hirsuta TaxID=260670 RepID=A0AA40B8D7_9PEZI|nr:hypothetical protein B0H67DRAFT_638143 [Lasiosphaeris hirsuta]
MASYAKRWVPSVSRREVDAAIPLFHDMFKDARHSLTESKAVYGVSVASLGVDNSIITLSGDLGVEAGLLGRNEKLRKHIFEEWQSSPMDDFNALWKMETRLQQWHEDVLPPPDSDSPRCLLFGCYGGGDNDGLRPLLKTAVLNRTELAKIPHGLFPATIPDAAGAVKDLACSFTIFTSLMDQVHIMSTLDKKTIKAEIAELNEVSSRIDRFADLVRKEHNPRLGWLREVGAPPTQFVMYF